MEINDFLNYSLTSVEVDSNGCHIWGLGRCKDGYGRLWLEGKTRRAHRVSYEQFIGEIPASLVVMHKCDNPACINPSHLSLGTQCENVNDMVSKGRNAKGSNQGNSKLTEEIVLEIFLSEDNYSNLARKHSVDVSLISLIKKKEIWIHALSDYQKKNDRKDSSKNMPMPKTNTSGFCGVRWDKSRQKWMAAITVNGKSKTLGRFDDFDEACRCRQDANERYGFGKNHGKFKVSNE